ncbi:MAG: GumC family protein [Planctomycetota bacterium]
MVQQRNDESAWSTEDWVREFTEIFFLRIHIVMLPGLLILLGAVLVALYWPRTYSAEAHVLVRARTQGVSTRLAQSPQEDRPLEEAHVTSEMEILQSPRLIKKTVMDLRKQEGDAKEFQGEEQIAEAVKKSRSQLEASVIPSSHVIRVEYFSRNPQKAEKFVDMHLDNYRSYRIQMFSTPEETRFLAQQTERYKEELQQVRDQIVQKTAEAGKIALIDRELSNNSDLHRELTQRLADLRSDLARQKEEIKSLEDALENDSVQFFAFLNNLSINRLGERLAALIEQREEVAQDYQPDSRRMESVREMVDKVYAKLRTEAQNIYQERRQNLEGTAAAIDSIENSLEELGAHNVRLNRQGVEIRRLQNRAEMLESSFRAFSEKKDEAEINAAVGEAKISGDVNILNEAAMTAEVAYPRKVPTLFIGLAAAIIVGLTLAFIADYLDQSIHRASEVHRFLELPVVCSMEDIDA